jgi:hypothetical protein
MKTTTTWLLLVWCGAAGTATEGFTARSGVVVTAAPSRSLARLYAADNNNNNNRWQREVDENSRRRVQAQGGGATGGTVAGAVLGGLLGGPFGALFGASVGSSMGSQKALDTARQEELQQLGLSQDMLDSANAVGRALTESVQGLTQVQDSLATQQRLARRHEEDAELWYDKAKACMVKGEEDQARTYLLERETARDRLKQVLIQCVTAKGQVTILQQNAAALEVRAMEIEALLQRSVGTTALQKTSDLGLSLSPTDPLLDKFKNLGID